MNADGDVGFRRLHHTFLSIVSILFYVSECGGINTNATPTSVMQCRMELDFYHILPLKPEGNSFEYSKDGYNCVVVRLRSEV